jgi:hypothetical protein
VAHVGDLEQGGAGYQLGRAAPARRVDQRVIEAVDDEHGHVHRRQLGAAVAARVDRGELAARTLRVERAVERCARRLLHVREVEVPLGGPHRVVGRTGDELVAIGWGRGEQHAERLGRRLAVGDIADRGHDRRHAGEAFRMLDRHRLHDHAAHRRADDVRLLDAEVVEQTDRIVAHVAQRVRHRRHIGAGEHRLHHRHRIDLLPVERGRQAAVAIVEAHHVTTVRGDQLAEPAGPRPSSVR